ncbi:hypothetical protein [Glaesserella parasuis]|uniref:Uncharacterized protein n=1 Tax=Glaesserella parasuis serovar 5 (strain SH0165) TaxID=557723 RepID=B8F619_GLAP5|nr:hypothetical protein [Glaesserella parasuis]ACL32771.1 hypothetical protein HAPS_1160 [Glaesserella parasuis SH0165]MDG6869235.1 hypothetical protein [Glaesserella parasuis]
MGVYTEFGIGSILTIKGSHESDVSLALERNIPKENIKNALKKQPSVEVHWQL